MWTTQALEFANIAQKSAGTYLWVDAKVLRDIAQGAAQDLRMAQDILVLPGDVAFGRQQQRGQHFEQGCLSRAVRAHQAEYSSVLAQRDFAQSIAAALIALAHSIDKQRWHSSLFPFITRGGACGVHHRLSGQAEQE